MVLLRYGDVFVGIFFWCEEVWVLDLFVDCCETDVTFVW